jgi:predicted nucleic acid-binding protein
MPTTFKQSDFSEVNGRSIFFDANVLIYLFWPTGSAYWEENYAKLFRNLLKQNNNLCVDFLVVSEVVNRIHRIEHRKVSKGNDYKLYRDSQPGIDALKDIYTIVQDEILNRFDVIGKSIDKTEIQSYLIVDSLDFADKATVSICKQNSMVLLTNDADFKYVDIDILTCNNKILNP